MPSRGVVLAITAGVAAGVLSSVATSWLLHPAGAPGPVISERGARPSGGEAPPADPWKAQREALEVHAREEVDPAWAPAVTGRLTDALSGLAPRGRFRMAGVDCRQTSCTATLDWASYKDAQSDYDLFRKELLHAMQRKLTCGVTVGFAPPADPAAGYEGKILFDQCRLL